MEPKSVTLDTVMSWKPCLKYSRGPVQLLFGGRGRLTARNILSMGIPPEDRVWAVLHPELLSKDDFYELGCRFVEKAEPFWRIWAEKNEPPHIRFPKLAVEARRRRIQGVTSDRDIFSLFCSSGDLVRSVSTKSAEEKKSSRNDIIVESRTTQAALRIIRSAAVLIQPFTSHGVAAHSVGSIAFETWEALGIVSTATECQKYWQVKIIKEYLEGTCG